MANMRRTQLYLEEKMHRKLTALGRERGVTLSELVREALDEKYGAAGAARRLALLQSVKGLWADRTDLPDTETYIRDLRDDSERWKRIWGEPKSGRRRPRR